MLRPQYSDIRVGQSAAQVVEVLANGRDRRQVVVPVLRRSQENRSATFRVWHGPDGHCPISASASLRGGSGRGVHAAVNRSDQVLLMSPALCA